MLFCFFNTTAQVKSIELPDVDVKVGVLTFPHFYFYVTKENVIIYNNDTIKILYKKHNLFLNILLLFLNTSNKVEMKLF